jgi:TM2 domain-containing membrane protein YozV
MTQPRYTKFCGNCGAEIDEREETCPKCGVKVAPPPSDPQQYETVQRKNEGIAAVASFIFPGFGQIYNGQIGKGIKFTIIGVALALSIAFLIGIIPYPIFWAYNIHDAYSTAKRINTGQVNM